MTGRAWILAAGVALMLPVVAQAQGHGWDCSDYDVLPQQGLNACVGDDYRAADAELNAVYQRVMGSVWPEMADRIRAAQRLWIPYRDAACEAEAELMRGGSAEPMLRLSCLARLTRARTAELLFFEGM
ncbi:MAG: DUF1311 domain-containing protein [Rhodobacteraceae bacterium]|jgi:uncharacterized protein YecT (DUF1311 family)|nr:DUF1311 domain-containing protein [Paracoccaceae bacterium]